MTLRSNLLLSTAAMILVGLIRPGFHAVVNRVFGPETNAHVTAIIALIFVAALPATAALPTAMVRHVSRALGADQPREAAGFARLAIVVAIVLVLVSSVGVLVWDLYFTTISLTKIEATLTVVGVAGYSFWRLFRTLLVALGHAKTSLYAELASVVLMFVGLALLVVLDLPAYLVGAVVAMYVLYTLFTIPIVWRSASDATLGDEGRRSFFRYNLIWFLGSASSLAARELSQLLLVDRIDNAIVGDISVAMSLLMLLAFAPRIIEVPLVHELSQLGSDNAERQRALTSKATHWLMILTFAAGCGASIVARPVLAFVGGVEAPVAAVAFALIASTFMIEMMMTPATNLLIAEAPPSVLTWIGVASLLAAFGWWMTPWSQTSALGVLAGLAISYAIKGVAIGVYAKVKLGVTIFLRPGAKLAAALAGAALVVASLEGHLPPFGALLIFVAVVFALFHREVADVRAAILGR